LLVASRQVSEEVVPPLGCWEASWLKVDEGAIECAQFRAIWHLCRPVWREPHWASRCEQFLFWVRLRQPSAGISLKILPEKPFLVTFQRMLTKKSAHCKPVAT